MPRTTRTFLLAFLCVLYAIPGIAQSIVRQIEIPATPGAIAVNPFSNRIYVAQDSADISSGVVKLFIIDGKTNTVIASRPSWGDAVHDMAVDFVTGRVYLVNCWHLENGEPACDLRILDSALNLIATIGDVDVGSGVAVNPITHRAYFGEPEFPSPGVGVVDTRTNKYLGKIKTRGPLVLTMDVDLVGNRVFALVFAEAVAMIDAHTSRLLRFIHTDVLVTGVAVDPFRRQLYITTLNEPRSAVMIYDTDTFVLKKTIAVGRNARNIAVDYISGFVFVTGENNTLSILNGNNLKLRKTIAGPTGPVDVNPYTRLVYAGAPAGDRTGPIKGRIYVIRE